MVVVCAAMVTAEKAMAQCCGCSASKGACAAESECAAKCPVTGEAVSKEASIDYKGGKLCFCCAGCIAKFKEDTAKYQAKANEQLVITGQAKQVRCPCGGKPNPSTKMKVCGIDVCFCCEKCQGKVKSASADKQCEMVFVKGFDKAFAVTQAKKKQADK
jgi:hypothetical protein